MPDRKPYKKQPPRYREIRDRFNCWLDRQPIEVRDELVRVYNGVSTAMLGRTMTVRHKLSAALFRAVPYDSLYPSQKDAIWMIKQNGGGICWHEVYRQDDDNVCCRLRNETSRTHKPLIIGLKAKCTKLPIRSARHSLRPKFSIRARRILPCQQARGL